MTYGPCPLSCSVQPPLSGALSFSRQLVSAGFSVSQSSSFHAVQPIWLAFIHSCQRSAWAAQTAEPPTPPSALVAPHSVTNRGKPAVSAFLAFCKLLTPSPSGGCVALSLWSHE